MRIGMISTYPPIECGIATYTRYLTDALRKERNDIYLVSHIGSSGRQVFPCFDYEDGDLAEKAYSTMVRFTPDVVHIQHEFGLFGKFAGVSVVPLILRFRLTGIPVVTTLHTVYRDPPEAHRLILQSILLHSNRVIVHEAFQKEILLKIAPLEAGDHIQIIPHGARELDPVPHARAQLKLPADKKIILLIGYFRPSKNFDLIVDLLPDILQAYGEAVLVIAGKTRGNEHLQYRRHLFGKIRQSPANDHIYLIRGQLKQQAFDTILSAADVVVLPYTINSQSGILAHALAFGRPVVASSSGAMKGILARSGAGLASESDREFVENIVRVLSDDDFSARLSANAKRYVRDVISWSHIAREHMEIYREFIDNDFMDSRTIWVE